MKTIKVGLIGYGMGGRIFHAPFIQHVDGLELVKIRETNPDNIQLAKHRCKDAQIVSRTNDILKDPEIDLVVIAVPNKFHFEIAKEALQMNKHVIVEKPFTVTTAEADELIRLSGKQQRIISVFHNRRWDSDFLTVDKIIHGGKLGRLVEFESHYDRFRNTIRPDTWKEEGSVGTGILYDLGSHLIDQAQVLFGLPEAVTGFIYAQREQSQIPDNFELILNYPALKVTLKSGMLVKEALPKYILLGDKGSFVKYGLDVQEAALDKGEKSISDKDWGKEPPGIYGTINYEENGKAHRSQVESEPGNYAAFYKNIYQAINGKEDLKVTAEQARNTIRIIELAGKSSQEKRTLRFE